MSGAPAGGTLARALRFELVKCLTGRWMMVALALGCALALAAAAESFRYVHEVLMPAFPYASNMSSFSNWMVANCNASLAATIFFYVAPLLAVMPFAWTYASEHRNGYEMQVAARIPARSIWTARAVTAFVSGFAAIAVPLLVNLVVLVCLLPSVTPIYEDYVVLGIFDDSLFSGLFYNAPVGYVAAMTLLDGFLMGTWALFVFSLSALTLNRVALMTLPYLALLGWQYVTKEAVAILGIVGFNVNLIDDMIGTFYTAQSLPASVAAQAAALLLVSLLCVRSLSRREVFR